MRGRLRVALVSFAHHADVMLGLCRALPNEVAVDCYLVLSLDVPSQNVVALRGPLQQAGLIPPDQLKALIDPRLLAYVTGRANLNLFYYHNLKFKDPRNVWLSTRFAAMLRKGQYDIVHFSGNDLKQWQIGWFLGGMPRVHTIHDWAGHSGERYAMAEWFNRKLARTATVIVHSGNVARQVLAEYPTADLHTVPFGPLDVYREFGSNGAGSRFGSGYALFFGRISPYKGLPVLLAAAKQACAADPRFRLVVAGQGDWAMLGSGLQAEPRIETLRGHLDNDTLASLISGCKYVVCPYTDASQSGVVMTAYAFDKPVLGTRVGGLDEVIEHDETGYLVPAGDRDALAAALLLLSSDESQIEHYRENLRARRGSGPYCWDTIGVKTLAVYRHAMQRQAA
jgi:glycosyltransferase involved in cell wall biosynthesis